MPDTFLDPYLQPLEREQLNWGVEVEGIESSLVPLGAWNSYRVPIREGREHETGHTRRKTGKEAGRDK